MPTIEISRTHGLPVNVLKMKIDKVTKDFQAKFGFRSEWESETELFFRRKGASGRIEIDETSFQLILNLGVMYRMNKDTIRQEIAAVVDENL